MITQDQVQSLTGATAYDRDGDKLGKIGAVYYDDQTNEPTWVTVNTGLFGMNESFVPVQGADFSSDRVTLGYDKAAIKDAPNVSEDGHLSPQEEENLYRHYGVGNGNGYDEDRTAGRTAEFAETGTAATGRACSTISPPRSPISTSRSIPPRSRRLARRWSTCSTWSTPPRGRSLARMCRSC